MKCANCGAQIDMNSEVCPHCGTPIKQFEKHRKDMRFYNRAFWRTRDTVVEENKNFSGLMARITIVVVMILIIIVLFALAGEAYSIKRHRIMKQIAANPEPYMQQIFDMEKDLQFEELYQFSERNQITSLNGDDNFAQFYAVCSMASDYHYITECMDDLMYDIYSDRSYYNDEKEKDLQRLIEYYTEFLESYKNQKIDIDVLPEGDKEGRGFRDESCYAPEHLEAMRNMRKTIDAYLVAYLGVPQEEIEKFDSMSGNKIGVVIEDSVKAKFSSVTEWE
ncbi:MAG: zinc ribbon domain-containing protein [Lachnospiraceae bacterium]|nr:zinc ribbon domain-containing protein [Lachnospiraceae bacterium]